MSGDSYQENNQHVVQNLEGLKKSLSFKDWKHLKDNQNSSREKSQHNKNSYRSKATNDSFRNARGDNRFYYNDTLNGSQIGGVPMTLNNFVCNSVLSDFMPTNNFNEIHNYELNFGMRKNGIDVNNFDYQNYNFNKTDNFGGKKFNNSNECNTFNLPESFFATDGIYRQKDLMQKPLQNPFRNEKIANQLLQKFVDCRYTKNFKKQEKEKLPQANTLENDITKLCNEPKVYVPNPKAKIDGKQYIPKPKIPEKNFIITKEDKKQQWKEYREAMKPFKNREFYNAKRVVQRLGKIPPKDLDEKQLIRLTNAREIMEAHKARLSVKYPNYVKAEDSSYGLGELYVLNKKSPIVCDSTKVVMRDYQNVGNFGDSPPCHFVSQCEIPCSDTAYDGFFAGGILEGTMQKLSTQ